MCLVRVATSGSKQQQASLARGFEIFVGRSAGAAAGEEDVEATCAGPVYLKQSSLPGPYGVTCAACPVGEYVTLRHIGPTADHLALSEMSVYSSHSN